MRDNAPILLVEDDDVDILNVQRAFTKNKIESPLYVVADGQEALNFLRHEKKFSDLEKSPVPGLILLDLNLPRMNGVELLKIIRSSENFKRIPVVILTTSKEELDRNNCYSSGIAGFVIKPVEFEVFSEAIRLVDLYWTLSELPTGT